MWVRNNKGNVFVGNLPPDFADERLAEAFDPFGIVLSAVVARDPETGTRLRYGFVDIATERAASHAISALNGSEIDGCKLNVKPREKGTARKPGASPKRPPARVAPRPAGLGAYPESAAPRAFRERSVPHLQMPPAVPPPAPAVLRRPSQTERAMEALPEIEPPPRRDFEVVRRPIRRSATPTFQVERRSLPRRA
jgi:RNA recognition motif-containing protein